jgi:hypothetical protein
MLRRAICWLLVGVAVALVGVNAMPTCLAESWTENVDGLVYEFKLRQGLMFHNGHSFTAEDVHFSFLRYKSTSAKLLHEQMKAVEIIDALFQQQAVERDRTMREALLHQLQRLMQERVMHASIAELAALHGVRPRVEEPGIGLIPLFVYFGPYEEMRLKRP